MDESYRGKRIRLHFDGVDYEAQFFLNGKGLGEHTGMFTPVDFEVSERLVNERLVYGQENLLAVVIEPAPYEQPQVGRTSRVRTHKSRMGYWWDFCPRMVHQGIWDAVSLHISGPARIEELFVRPQLSEDLRQARIPVLVEFSVDPPAGILVEADLSYEGQVIASRQATQAAARSLTNLQLDFELDDPHLWWPNGCGEQPLYQVEVRLRTGEDREISDLRTVTFGIRRIELTSNETDDPTARPYTLVVNGRRVYMKGWNWVPLDALYGVERSQKLKRLLQLARRAHVNLLRVWGGGLIEKDSFYDLCDRLGILVWQEFIQSSSGIENNPPEDPEFIRRMVREAEQIIPRKRNHPSLALWCGGNELQSGPEQPVDESHPMLAGLQGVVKALDPDRLWLPTSPTGRFFSNSLENIARDPSGLHDVHGPWEHQGLDKHFSLYNQGTSLLHSEFGVEGITNLSTLNRTIAAEHQRPVSLANPFWFHLGSWWVKEASWRAMFGELQDMGRLVQATQFLQADGLRYAVEADRRRKYQNSGSLPWQFNEPYPMAACTSAVDYYTQPKPAYYAVASAYSPVHVSAKFPRQAWDGKASFEAEAWASNSLDRDFEEAVLKISIVGASGRRYQAQKQVVSFRADAATLLETFRWDLNKLEEDIFFLNLVLSHPDGALLSGNRYVFSRTKDLSPLIAIPPTELQVEMEEQGDRWEVVLANSGGQTALFVWLQEDGPADDPARNAYFSDNHFCLFLGESRKITADWEHSGKGARVLSVRGWNTSTNMIGR